GKPTTAIVQIKTIRLGTLYTKQPTCVGGQFVVLLEFGHDAVPVLGRYDGTLEGVLPGWIDVVDRSCFVVADEQIEIAVAIDVREGDRRAAPIGAEPGFFGHIREAAAAVVKKDGIGPIHGGDEQIQIAITVD